MVDYPEVRIWWGERHMLRIVQGEVNSCFEHLRMSRVREVDVGERDGVEFYFVRFDGGDEVEEEADGR